MLLKLSEPDFKENIINKGLDHSEEFTWDNTIDKTIKVYEALVFN